MSRGSCVRCEISDLLSRYCWEVDHKNWDAWLRCFSPDGVFAVPEQRLTGRSSIGEFVRSSMGDYQMIRHLQHMPAIEVVDDSTARSRSYFEFKGITRSGSEVVALGSYIDRLVNEGGTWYFDEREVDFNFYVRRDDGWQRD